MKLINAILLLAGLSASAGSNLRGQERRIEVRRLSTHKSSSSGSSSSSSSSSSRSGSRSGRGRCGRIILIDECGDSSCDNIARAIEDNTKVNAVCVDGRRALKSTTSSSGSGSGSGSRSSSGSSSSSSSSRSGSSGDERIIGTHRVSCDTTSREVEITVYDDLDRTFSESRADDCARVGSSGSSSSSSSSSSSGSGSRSSGSSGSGNTKSSSSE